MKNKDPLPSNTARVYVAVVIAAGILVVTHSLFQRLSEPVSYHWFVLAGLTLLSGSFTVRVPTIPARLSVSETFVFAAVLLFGAPAATLIVVLDSLVISLWLKQRTRRMSRIFFNMAAPAVAIWIAAQVFFLLAGVEPLANAPQPILSLVAPLLVLAILYFLLNSFLIAGAIAFEQNLSAIRVWRQNFMWLSLNYLSGASVAALLLPYLQADYDDDFVRVLGVLLPLLAISYLTFKTALGRVDDANKHLSELNKLYLSTIETLAMAIDAKDQITHGHIRRVQSYALRLAQAVGVNEPVQIKAIEAAALLHDMGKLAVPEYILNKPGPLTPAEFERMKLHASVGADILTAIAFPYPVVPIVRHHHENWDGTGYPDGLAGSDIPIGARLLSVVDCYDALTSDRPYRPRLSSAEAIHILRQRRGSMYDPLVVDSFLRIHSELAEEAREADPKPPLNGMPAVALSPAISTARGPFEEITGGADEMQEVFELSRGLANSHHLTEIGPRVLQHTRRLIPYSSGIIYLYDSSSDDFWSAFVCGEHSGLLKNIRIKCGQRLTGWVGANGRTIRNSDPVLDLGDAARTLNPRPSSALTVPLADPEGTTGVISLYSTEQDGFSEEHQRVLEILAPHISSSIRRSSGSRGVTNKAFGSSREQTVDHSTLSPYSAIEIQAGIVFSVITFRMIFGESIRTGTNAVGDEVRRTIAALRTHMRTTDVLLQHDSTEVSLILPTTGAAAVSDMVSAIRQDLDAKQEGSLVTTLPRWVVSTATSPIDGSTVGDVIRVARARGIPPLRERPSVAEGPAGKAVH